MPASTPRTPSALDALADAYVDDMARRDPFLATQLGISGHDARTTDHSPSAAAERTGLSRDLLARIAEVPDADDADRVTRAALTERLGVEIELADRRLDVAAVNNLASTLQIRDVLDLMPADTPEDWEVITERLSGFPASLEGWAESLREAASQGVCSARRQLQLGAEQARGYASKDGVLESFAAGAVGDEGQRVRAAEAAGRAAQAYRDIADVLESLIPSAPEPDAVGREVYSLTSQVFLGTEIDLEETYAWGIEELRKLVAEQEEVASRINERARNGAGRSVPAAREVLDADPARILQGTEALRTWMQDLSDRALADLAGTHFDIPDPLRRLECRIATTGSGGIYYTGPSEDLTRAGRMWWDVPPGTTEFRTWAETTTVYHEGVPGHHLQVGTQTMQAGQLNRWRAMMCWVSGHGEGWALYAERLMEQLGYLDDDGDRLGMLDAQRMRAGRVVLDIGLHVGLPMPDRLEGSTGGAPWTYDSAWDFMSTHWGIDPAQQRFELHRYLGWPGQAPSYSVGQRAWEQLRDRVVADGDPRDFHRRALELGSLPLSVLHGALA